MFYTLSTLLMRLALRALSRWEVEGAEMVPKEGPFVLISNHLSLVDPPLLSASIPRRIIFMAKEEAYRSFPMGLGVRAFGAFPVRRGEPDRRALRRAEEVLRRGEVLGMFPEGTRSQNAQMQRAYPGTCFIALRSGALILPVGITGTERIEGLYWLFQRPAITVRIGEPFHLLSQRKRLSSSELEALTEAMMRKVAKLLPESYQGVYREAAAMEAASVTGV